MSEPHLRIRPGIERDDSGRWRSFVMLELTVDGILESQRFEGEWLATEAAAETQARDLSRMIRANVARNPRIRAE